MPSRSAHFYSVTPPRECSSAADTGTKNNGCIVESDLGVHVLGACSLYKYCVGIRRGARTMLACDRLQQTWRRSPGKSNKS